MRRTPNIVAVVIVSIVLLGWFVIPNYLPARNRSRQNHTMADMRSIATAWEARATDRNSYSVGGSGDRRVSAGELARTLSPTYIRTFPRVDGWGREFEFAATAEGQAYVIRSFASDGRPDRIANLSGATTDFADDIIYSNGSFVRYPENAG